MSATFENPIPAAFASAVAPEITFGEVLITRNGAAFELRHLDDRTRPVADLRKLNRSELRDWFQTNSTGDFRPLRTAPTMQRGWICTATNAATLILILDCIYPGAAADWFAAINGTGSPTHYRDFTGRQSGMYRVTAMLTDTQSAEVTRDCCDAKKCLRQRQWIAGDLSPDSRASKSCIPCWEPCAILLESARLAFREFQSG